MKRFPLIFGIILLLLAAAQAQNAQSGSTLATNPVYEKNCARCHGKTGKGRFMAGPSLNSDKTAAMPADDVRKIITNGQHRMPKFDGKLSPTEIDILVTQIKATK